VDRARDIAGVAAQRCVGEEDAQWDEAQFLVATKDTTPTSCRNIFN